ncbi:hypothetical protein KC973_02265 [Candidatus Saccharibacteria bacterium]|nr:hypothetical protein [Candidatus Saccharibacteria bacterium]
MIEFPKFPMSLRVDAGDTDMVLLAKECTALLVKHEKTPFAWITKRYEQYLKGGKKQNRRDVLFMHYLYCLEEARLAALDSGFAEPGLITDDSLKALQMSPLDRLSPRNSARLRDAIGDVKRLDDDLRRGTRAPKARKGGKGRDPRKAGKSARDKEIRNRMKQPKGQKPQPGRAA